MKNRVSSTQEKLLKVAQKYIKADELGPKEYKNQRREERTRDWQEKPLHDRFLRCTEEVASSKTWEWLRRGELKKETEGLITAAQDQSLRTNVMKARIDKSHVSSMCRMCNAAEETVFHIVSECRVHAQTEYKGRHDKLAKVIHWDLCKKYGVKVQSKWYDHVPEKVEETDHVKILWDFNIQTDHVIPFDPTGYLRSLSCTTLRSRGLQKEPGIVMQLVTNGSFSHQLKCKINVNGLTFRT